MAIRITVCIEGLFCGYVTIGRYGKWLTDINLLLILIRQMAALARRALAEVCTVPVLLVTAFFFAGVYLHVSVGQNLSFFDIASDEQ